MSGSPRPFSFGELVLRLLSSIFGLPDDAIAQLLANIKAATAPWTLDNGFSDEQGGPTRLRRAAFLWE